MFLLKKGVVSMELEEYEIVKLYDKLDHKNTYVVILRVYGGILKVKVLQQPSYNLVNKRFSDDIFEQYCHSDEEAYCLPLDFNIDDMTLNVHINMCQELSRVELVDLLKYLVYTNLTKTLSGQAIMSHALDKLK